MCHVKQGDLFAADADARASLVARWLTLTRVRLPALALAHRWPIHSDHCLMRVCLDAALGTPWSASVERPALRHMTVAQLAAAVGIAEGVATHPDTLPGLNARSLAGRRAARTGGVTHRSKRGPTGRRAGPARCPPDA